MADLAVTEELDAPSGQTDAALSGQADAATPSTSRSCEEPRHEIGGDLQSGEAVLETSGENQN